MISKLHHCCLMFLLIAFIATPGAAQLLDPEIETQSWSEEQAGPKKPEPQRATEKPRSGKRAAPDKKEIPADRPSQEPPPSIARRPPAPKPAVEPPPVEDSSSLFILFLSLVAVGVVLLIVERARSWITTNIPLRRVLGVLGWVLRLTAFALVVAIVLELLPDGPNWILWALGVLALVVGWSVRDLFADLIAGGILAAERRVKKGMWVSGDGFQGTVEGRSLRATWLRDGQGHRLTVPNRAMVGAPMVYDAGVDAEHEVEVRLEGYQDAGKVRLALTDAILSSPWVLAGATPVVLRDPADPVVWRVRTKLLEPRFSVHFEGELLERVEDLLRYEPPPEERETVPTGDPIEG